MLIHPLLLLSLAAAPIKVATMRLNVLDAKESWVDFYTGHFADRLVDQGLEVTSPREISTLVGLERQRQLLGCAEGSTCLIEIAGALGVDGIAMGDLARVSDGFQVNLRVLSPKTGKRLASFSGRARGEADLLAALSQAAELLSRQLGAALARPTAKATAPSRGSRRWWWVPAFAGAGGLAGGSAALAMAESDRARLATGTLDAAEAQRVLSSGKTARALGYASLGVGAAALATAAGLLLFGSEPAVVPLASAHGGGVAFSFSGSFP